MKKCLLFLSAAVLSLCFWLPGSYAQAAGNPVIRIGLFYGSNGLPAANLQNVSGKGSGYSLGFYNQDAGNSFVPLMQVSQTEITVVKDKLIYISGEKDYSDVATASYRAVIAPYHLQTDRSFGTWQQAQEFSQSLGQDAFPAYVNGAYVVRIGQYRSAAEAQAEAETVAAQAGAVTVAGGSETCYTVTVTGESTILFELDMGGTPLGIQPQGTDAQTWFKGNTYYGGFQYDRVNGNDLTVVNMVKLDDYVKGVVPYEMSPSWPVEALKAQALCARNYAVNSQGKHASQGFDLCNTTDCQVYQGTASANANSDRAVEDTSGQYILYNGEIAEVFYHASSGGSTEDSENIWSAAVPYLRGVEDTYLTNPIQWSATLTCEQAAQILRDKGYSVSGVTDIYVSQTSSHGNVIGLTVERQGDSPAGLFQRAGPHHPQQQLPRRLHPEPSIHHIRQRRRGRQRVHCHQRSDGQQFRWPICHWQRRQDRRAGQRRHHCDNGQRPAKPRYHDAYSQCVWQRWHFHHHRHRQWPPHRLEPVGRQRHGGSRLQLSGHHQILLHRSAGRPCVTSYEKERFLL